MNQKIKWNYSFSLWRFKVLLLLFSCALRSGCNSFSTNLLNIKCSWRPMKSSIEYILTGHECLKVKDKREDGSHLDSQKMKCFCFKWFGDIWVDVKNMVLNMKNKIGRYSLIVPKIVKLRLIVNSRRLKELRVDCSITLDNFLEIKKNKKSSYFVFMRLQILLSLN